MPPDTTARSAPPSGQRRMGLTPLGAVALAGVLYAALTVVFVGLDRQLRWDEVTYLAQVTPGQLDVWFGPQRARGMSVVALPVALFGAPLTLLRVWMVAVSAVALALAYRPWARYAGWTGAAAAVVAAIGWVPMYFAVELYPNLLAGFAAVGATGHLVCWLARPRPEAADAGGAEPWWAWPAAGRGDLVAVALGTAFVAWLRPSESVWLAFGLIPVTLIWARTRALPALSALALGGFVGWLPWLLEAIVRFGGPFERLNAAAGTSASGEPRNSLIQYLNLVEGPVRRVVADPVLTVPALTLLVLLAALALLGVAQRLDGPRRAAAAVGGVAAAAMVTPYLLLNAGINLRYVLPGMLLAAVPIGAGAATVAGAIRRARSPVAAVVASLVVVGLVGWQGQLAAANSADIAPLQARPVPLGQALAAAADGEPCAFLSNVQWPEIQWHSGCAGEVLDLGAPLLQCPDARRDLAELAADGHRVFVLARGEPPATPALEGWEASNLPEPEDGAWWLYERPAELGPSDPPTVPAPPDTPGPCPPSRAPDTSDAQLRLGWSTPEP
ncbi:MAG: hypothetical protein WEB09_10975 [Nitriliruptor sp.]